MTEPQRPIAANPPGSRPLQHGGGDTLPALACAAVVVLLVLATWPFGGLPFNDDPSYNYTVQVLARTGHLRYNGWATAALGVQAYWAAIWVKLFGFSFTVVRLTTLPAAAGCAAFSFLLARRCGLNRALAIFSALTLCCSPMFLPLSATFMTDIPGLLFTLAALYAVIAAGRCPTSREAIAWIGLAVALSLVGGTARQIVWVSTIAGLPAIAWQRRAERPIVLAAAVGWILTGIGAAVTLHWFNTQPYAIPEESITGSLVFGLHHPTQFAAHLWGFLLTLALLSLPVLIARLGAVRRVTVLQGIAAVVVLAILMVARKHWIIPQAAPFIGNIIGYHGLLDVRQIGPGRPPALNGQVWGGVSLLLYAVLSLGVVRVVSAAFDLLRRRPTLRVAALTPSQWIVATLLAFAAVYFALVLPRAASDRAYDRYLLPLIPCVTIPLLLTFQAGVPRPPLRAMLAGGWAVLAAFALFGVALTQDDLALGRARVVLTDRLQQAGIPRAQIDGGFEFNFWTQLQSWGYINDARIRKPAGAYHHGLPLMPASTPLYRVEFKQRPLAANEIETDLPHLTYFTLLPPLHRTLIVRKLIAPDVPPTPSTEPAP